MANGRYQYETSPRKLEPKYKKTTKRNLRVIETPKEQKLQSEKEQRRKNKKQICIVVATFAIFLILSYRNSLINEEFKVIQNQKSELSMIEKTNKQLEVSIESSLNLKNIEKVAAEQLGMQKQSTEQTIYTKLPKEDYIEVAGEEIKQEEVGFFESILNWFKK